MVNLKTIALKVHKAIFGEKDKVEIDGEKYKVGKFSKSGLRYVDYDNYRFVEQNPKKNSHWAKKAREGQEITWAISLESGDFVANVHNGEFKDFR